MRSVASEDCPQFRRCATLAKPRDKLKITIAGDGRVIGEVAFAGADPVS